MNNEQIVTSLLDTDLYTFTVGQVAFHLFPQARVKYQFINRNKTPFPPGFAHALKEQLDALKDVHLTTSESKWLNSIPYLRPTYIEWLSSYRFDTSEVTITQKKGILEIEIDGAWYRTIMFEVPLMAIISELYFQMTKQKKTTDWEQRIRNKAYRLSDWECYWIDFGSRRRYSGEVQDRVVETMKQYKGFLGTSNPHFAMKHGLTPHGTYSHQGPMAMAALYGPRMANRMWMKHWSEHFGGQVGVALTDTFTTEKFLEDFDGYNAKLFDGVRHDSGDPVKWGNRMLEHYRSMNIPTSNKRFVFSDGLDDITYRDISWRFRDFAQPVGGIGTFLTNDVFSDDQKRKGMKPLNMVIKLTEANFGKGWVDVVKLSDNPGKHTGNQFAIDLAKLDLNISCV